MSARYPETNRVQVRLELQVCFYERYCGGIPKISHYYGPFCWFFVNFHTVFLQGLLHLHSSTIISHGYLTSFNCLIDARFVVRIADGGLAKLRNTAERQPFTVLMNDSAVDLNYLLWRAPELLRTAMSENGTQVRRHSHFSLMFAFNVLWKTMFFFMILQRADVYSFAILMQQIILRSLPFSQMNVNEPRTGQDIRELLTEVSSAKDFRQI